MPKPSRGHPALSKRTEPFRAGSTRRPQRWVASRKAGLLAALRDGLITAEEACRRHEITGEELSHWQALIEQHGVEGLCVSHIQKHRGSHHAEFNRTTEPHSRRTDLGPTCIRNSAPQQRFLDRATEDNSSTSRGYGWDEAERENSSIRSSPPQLATEGSGLKRGEPVTGMTRQIILGSGALVGRTLAEVERCLILGTLEHCAGNRTRAAQLLGLSLRTLRNKIGEYKAQGIDVPAPGHRPGSVRPWEGKAEAEPKRYGAL